MSRLPREIRTRRLCLRLPSEDDARALNTAIAASQEALSRWMDWAVEPQTLAQTTEFIRGSLDGWSQEKALNLLMVTADDDEIIGATGYPRLDWSVPCFEIGYWCRSDRTGRGYVSEATWALARHAFESLAANRVELRMDEKNRQSWAVAERLGFRHEATLRNEVRVPHGSLRDTRIYGAVSLRELVSP